VNAWRLVAAATLLVSAACTAVDLPGAASQLRAAETAFAQSMADRNFDAFASHVADDAVFINGGQPLRGKAAVLAHWKRFFETPAAPFSWRPELVEVAAGGDIGYTEGPVVAPDGRVTLRFYSTWRRSASGRWQVVFDNGYPISPR
jgi:ketosteroid isomerase-like protein